jgi:dTDP-glucose 4,6-dehydratase
MILVTGGAGFIGSNFVLDWLAGSDEPVVTLDALTYAGNLANLHSVVGDPRHTFVRGDIADRDLVERLLAEHRVRAIVHFAAESHVDRSIHGPEAFVATNIVGTFRLLEAARAHWTTLPPGDREAFRFLHVSTDEVFGSLGPSDAPFSECSPYRPNSPYAASKAASDHLVRAHHHTFGLPVLTTNCSNNYGPWQFPEKLIPLCIHRALAGEPLPIYGDGRQVRDWLYVGDHCAAIRRVLEAGRPGKVYCIGGSSEMANIDLVTLLCGVLDEAQPRADGMSYARQIKFVTDRPGHDRRYAIDHSRLYAELGWRPAKSLATGLHKTTRWYLDHGDWVEDVTSGAYRQWIERHYATPERRTLISGLYGKRR